MRIVLLSALLIAIAACTMGPPPEPTAAMPLAAAPGAPAMIAAPPAPGPIALAPMPAMPPPPPVAAPLVAAPPPASAPVWPFWQSLLPPPGPARLTLSNFSFDRAHVVAVATASPDCTARLDGDTEVNFTLPLNATRIIEAPPGDDVCWRREVEPAQIGGRRYWSAWNRVYLSVAGSADSRL